MKNHSKVLIAEDSTLQAEMLEFMLQKMGITDISKAADGLSAMEQFEYALNSRSPYTLVFLDIVMPEMDGQETLKRMREMEKANGVQRSVIIMTTALTSPTDMMDALLVGDSDDYIVKPVEKEQLQTMLEKYRILHF